MQPRSSEVPKTTNQQTGRNPPKHQAIKQQKTTKNNKPTGTPANKGLLQLNNRKRTKDQYRQPGRRPGKGTSNQAAPRLNSEKHKSFDIPSLKTFSPDRLSGSRASNSRTKFFYSLNRFQAVNFFEFSRVRVRVRYFLYFLSFISFLSFWLWPPLRPPLAPLFCICESGRCKIWFWKKFFCKFFMVSGFDR